MTDLVVVSLEAWDEVWRRNQHLVAGLLRSEVVTRVLFIEPPVDLLHQIRSGRRPSSSGLGLRQVDLEGADGRIWAYRPAKLLPRRLDPQGDRRRAKGLARVARQRGLEKPVLWVNDPVGAELMTVTGWPTLYDITDDWLVAQRPDRELSRLRTFEGSLFRDAAQVVVCSDSLLRSRSVQRDVRLIPNAVDLSAYEALAPRPRDLPVGPVALYVGTAHRDRLDIDLCVRTSERLGETGGTVVLVGPHPLAPPDLRALEGSGVLLLGPRPSSSVPAYLQNAEVLLVPHVITPFTLSLDPIKAYEYRAAARPVVSTAVPGFADADDPYVVVTDRDTFPDAVVGALWSDPPSEPCARPPVPSWADRVADMADVIERVAG